MCSAHFQRIHVRVIGNEHSLAMFVAVVVRLFVADSIGHLYKPILFR